MNNEDPGDGLPPVRDIGTSKSYDADCTRTIFDHITLARHFDEGNRGWVVATCYLHRRRTIRLKGKYHSINMLKLPNIQVVALSGEGESKYGRWIMPPTLLCARTIVTQNCFTSDLGPDNTEERQHGQRKI